MEVLSNDFRFINETKYESDFTSVLESAYFSVIASVIYIAIFILACLGNGTILFIIFTYPRMNTVTNYFIANLALSDILILIFCMPFSIISQLILKHVPFGENLWKCVNYTQVVFVFVSAYTTVALALERYQAVIDPLRFKLSKKVAKIIIAALWIGSLIMPLCVNTITTVVYSTSRNQTSARIIFREDWYHPEQSFYYSTFLLILQFILPLAVIIFAYSRIALIVWKQKAPGEADDSRDKRMVKSKKKMIKMMVCIIIIYTMCWLPYNIIMILWTFNMDYWSSWKPFPYIWFALHCLATSHSCYNPIIYFYFMDKFYYAFIEVAAKIPYLRKYLSNSTRRIAYIHLYNSIPSGSNDTSWIEMKNVRYPIYLTRKARWKHFCSLAKVPAPPKHRV